MPRWGDFYENRETGEFAVVLRGSEDRDLPPGSDPEGGDRSAAQLAALLGYRATHPHYSGPRGHVTPDPAAPAAAGLPPA